MPWGAAIAAGGSIIGGLIGGSKQSSDISGAQKQALALEKQGFQQTTALNSGYVAAGNNALTDITDLSGANGTDAQTASANLFKTDPGYQFDLTQGLKATDNGAAARGLGTSGANIEGETNYAEGVADNAYSGFYNRLSALAGMGQTAIGQDSQAGSSASANAGQTAASAGQDQANIDGNSTSGITNALTQFLNNGTVQTAIKAYSSPTNTSWNGSSTGWQ